MGQAALDLGQVPHLNIKKLLLLYQIISSQYQKNSNDNKSKKFESNYYTS